MTDDRFASPGWFLRPDKWHEWMPNVPWMNGLASPEPRQLPAPFPLKWEQGPNGGLTARPDPLPNPDGSYWWESINPMQHARGNAGVAPPINVESASAPISTIEDLLRTTPAALARGTTMALGSTGDARERAGNGITWALQKAGIEPTLADLLWYRNPSAVPVRQLTDFGLSGLEAAGSPNLASLLRGEPPPPYRHADGSPAIVAPDARLVPNAAGKVPSTEDPRPFNAALEALQLGTNFLPGGFGGSAVRAGVRAAEAMPLASRNARLYNPPIKPQRPFEADYNPAKFPEGPPADAIGRLTRDNKGRELVSEHVVGRRTVGGADEARTPAEFDAIAEKGFGRRPEVVTASSLPRNTVGIFDPNTGRIAVDRGLPAETKDVVGAHEVGHGVNHKVGEFVGLRYANLIPITKKMRPELRVVYNDLNNPDLAAARAIDPNVNPAVVRFGTRVTPETSGYKGPHIDAEYMAEAFRAAGVNPNYMKTVAPTVYRQFQDFFNAHPHFRNIIQFNALGGPAFLGGIDPGSPRVAQQSAPVLSQ